MGSSSTPSALVFRFQPFRFANQLSSPSRSAVCIDRCICSRVLFSDLQAEAERTGATSLEALQDVREFGVNCRLCHPYVRRMLRDGTTAFHEILREDG